MIEVTGRATLKVPYKVRLNITEEQFDAMSERQQNELLDSTIDWHSTMSSAEADDFDVDDVETVEA